MNDALTSHGARFEVISTGAALGAEIVGLDLPIHTRNVLRIAHK